MFSDGQVVFSGPTHLATAHFAALGHEPASPSVSIADHVLDLVIKAPQSTVNQLLAAWGRSDIGRQDGTWVERLVLDDARTAATSPQASAPGVRKYEASYSQQLAALAARLSSNLVRHPLLIALNFAFTLVISLGIGAVYWDSGVDTGGIQDRFGSLFFQLLYLALMGLSSLPIWADDRLLFLREREAGAYGTAAYFTAVVLFDLLPMRVLPPFFFVTFSYWMIGLRKGAFYWARSLLVLILGNITATSLSMAIGAAVPSVALANMFGSLALLLAMLFGGFLLSRNKMPGVVGWAANLSYVRYAFEALVDTEFHGATGYRFTAFAPPGARPDQIPHVDVTGDEVLMTFGFTLGAYWWDVFMLVMLSCGFLAATFVLLKWRRT